MALDETASTTRPEEPAGASGFIDLLRSFPGQARLALGTRGVLWASAAGVVGLICCGVVFADIMLSLHRSDIDPQRRRAREVVSLDNGVRLLMRGIFGVSTSVPTGVSPLREVDEPWRNFAASLGRMCHSFPVPAGSKLAPTCATLPAFVERTGREMASFQAGRGPIDPVILRELIELRDDIHEISVATSSATDGMIGQLIDDYTAALVVLTLSTAGFVTAGLVLILLVGRTSMDYHAQWRRAARAASDAGASRDTLTEVIEALPAGVAVYDADERLILFNSVAADLTPMLHEPGAIGRSYEWLVRERSRRAVLAGLPPQPVEEWLERFRSKTDERTRQSEDGRWFEWSEKGTASGLTVGLRVEVTNIKQHEFALERARTEYQTLVDSLADVAYRLDVETGKFTFASAAAEDFFGVPPEQFVGTHFLQHIAPERSSRCAAPPRARSTPTTPAPSPASA